MRQRRGIGAALLVAAVALVHWPPPDAEFNLDDGDFVLDNQSLRSVEGATRAWLRSFPPGQNDRALYRPLTNTSHALEWAVFGAAPRGYFFVNVALYAAVVLVFWRFVARFGCSAPRRPPDAEADAGEPGAARREAVAFGAALLFAMHPVHSEVVDGVAGRSELLSLLFSLLALMRFQRALGEHARRADAALALVWTLFALASKESGLAVVGAVVVLTALAHLAAPGRLPWRRLALELAPFALVAGGYLALRTGVLGRFSPAPDTRSFAFADLGERLATLGAVQLEYLRLLVWPWPLQPDFYYAARPELLGASPLRSVLGWLAIAAAAFAFAALWRASVRAARRGTFDPAGPRAAALLGISLYALYMLPISHVFDVGALMAERFAFAPSAGALLALAGATCARLPADARWPARFAAVAVLLLATVGAGLSHQRARAWRDGVVLWSAAVEAMPTDARAWNQLAAAFIRRGDATHARAAAQRALALDPRAYGPRLNLALLDQEAGDFEAADAHYRALLGIGRLDHHGWLNRARLEARRGRLWLAREYVARAIRHYPNFAEAPPLRAQLDAELAAARALLDARGDASASDATPEQLARLAAACRAIGDRTCSAHFAREQRRARQLRPQPAPGSAR